MSLDKSNLKFPIKVSLETQKLGEKAGRINIKLSVEIYTDNKEILPSTDHEKVCIVNTVNDLSQNIIKILNN